MRSTSAAPLSPRTQGSPSGLSSFLQTLAGRFGMIALNACTGILTARALKPEGRGELAAMILWPVFLSQVFTFSLPVSLLYSIRRGKTQNNTIVGTALTIAMIISAVLSVAGFILLPHWLNHYSPEVVRTAQYFMISAPLTMLNMMGRGALEARGKFGSSSLVAVLSPAFTVVGLLGLLATHRLTAFSAAWVYVLSGAPPVLLVLYELRRDLVPDWTMFPSASKELLSYGLRSYGIDICGTLAQYVDQALVIGMLSPSAMGSYTVALSLSRMVGVVFGSVSTVLFPKAMNRDLESTLRLSIRALVGSLVVTTPAVVLLLFGSARALRLLYGREYAIAQGLLRILILEAILSGCINVMSQIFMATGKPGTVTVLQASGLALAVPMIALLVPHFGTEGAGIALLLSAIFRALLLVFSYRRLFPDLDEPLHHQVWGEARGLAGTYGSRCRQLLTPGTAS